MQVPAGRHPTDNATRVQTTGPLGGGMLKAEHLQCLRRLAKSPDMERENLTSLTVFHLVEMGLLARDARGSMGVTALGAAILADSEHQAKAKSAARPLDAGRSR